MSVQAAQKTEADATHRASAYPDGCAQPKEVGGGTSPVDWNALVGRLAERVWQEVRVDTHAGGAARRTSQLRLLRS